jgi:hypothetical protein
LRLFAFEMNSGSAEKCCAGTEVCPELAALALRDPAREISSKADIDRGRSESVFIECFTIDSFFTNML